MYSGYTTTAIALRAKSSFAYAPLPFLTERADHCRGECSPYAQSSLHGLSISPRFFLCGHYSRQYSLIYWSPSRSLLAGRSGDRCRLSGDRCRRSSLRELGLGLPCRGTSSWSRSSDGSFWEMVGLLAEVRSCYRESYGAQESINEGGSDKVGSLGKNLKREVKIESVDGESRRSSRARKDGSSSVYDSESSSDWYSGSERKEGKGRRLEGESWRNYGSGRVDVREREVRRVRKYEDDAGSKKRYVSEYDAGWDSSRELEFQEKYGNSRASSSSKFSELEMRDREEKAASFRSSGREAREKHGYKEQDVARQEGFWRFTGMSEVSEDEARTALSCKNMADDARKVNREEGSSSAGKWQGKVDKRVVGRAGWKVEDREERDAPWMDSAHEIREVCGYGEENVYREKELREGSQKIARTRTSQVHGDDSRRFSSFQSTVDARKVDRQEGLAARRCSEVDQQVVGRAEWRLRDRGGKGASSVDLAHEAREEYGYEGEQVVRRRESRVGSQKVTGTSDAYEDGIKRSSISKNMVDARKVRWEVSSAANKHAEFDKGVIGDTELRKSSQKHRDITEVRESNTESTSNSERHYGQMRDREDRSASAQSSVHVSRDKRSLVDQQVVGRMESKKHNESHSDVSRVHLGDAERTSSSQRLLEARKDDREDYSASALNLVSEVRDQQNPINEQFTHQSSSRRTHERNTQILEVSRSDTERVFKTKEIYNTRIDGESVNRQNSSRRESEKETNVSEYSRNDIEMVSNSQEIPNMSLENRRGNSSPTLVQDKMGKQRTLTGDSSQPTKRQMGFSGSVDSGSSSVNTCTHEIDHQTSKGEMYIIKEGSLESASRSDQSSALYIGEFVNKVKQEITTLDELDHASNYSPGIQIEEVPSGTSDATTVIHSILPAPASEDKDERYVEGARKSTSSSGMKGPSDEIWDVRGLTSQQTSRTEETEEEQSVAEAVDSTTITAGTDNAVARRSHRSLWTYVADIIRLSWGLHAKSHNPTLKSGTRSSSNESVSSEAWFSGQEPDDDDEINKKRSGTPKEPLLIKRPVDESDPRVHAGSSTGSSEVPKLANRVVMPEAGTSTSEGTMKTGLAKGSSTVSRHEGVGWTEDEKSREGIPSNAITVDQSSALTDVTAAAIKEEEITNIGNVQMPANRDTELEEQLIEVESPKVGKADGKEGELKRMKLQRSKQVLKENFDEWEEAYRLESEQRKTDEFFMREALVEAQKAADTWEVPVGAVLVQNGKIIARGCNLVEELRDSTAHAEMICIREASNLLRTWRLAETTLYATLEPCPMCAGAILQARIDTVVWGAPNKLLGADGSWVRLFPGDGGSNSLTSSNQTVGPVHPFHPKITIRRGVLATECSEVMQQFFQLRRKKNKNPEPSPPSCLPVSTHPTKFFTKIHDLFSVMFCL